MNSIQPIITYGTNLYNGKRNLIVVLFFSDNCNYNCVYCGNKFPRTKLKLNTDLVYKYLTDLSETIDGKIFIEILGGEPTTHENFYEFCSKLALNKCFFTSVYTNYSADLDMYIDLYKKGINIIPSWHSLPNDRQNQKFIQKIIDTTKFIDKRINIRVMYEPEYNKYALNTFNTLYKYNNKLNIEFSLLVNSTTYRINYTKQQLDEYKICQEKVYHENDDIFIQYSDGSTKMIGYYDIFKNEDLSFRFWKCYAGIDTIYIHSDGNAYICPKFFTDNKKPLYNIYDINAIKMRQHPTICPFSLAYCECDKEVKKEHTIKW